MVCPAFELIFVFLEVLNKKDANMDADIKIHTLTKVSARFVGGDSPLEALNEKDAFAWKAIFIHLFLLGKQELELHS